MQRPQKNRDTGRPEIVQDSNQYGVRLRVTLHLMVPAFSISWVAEGFFEGVFPLFGNLRRYWGRAVGVSGRLMMEGRPSTARRSPVIRHNFVLEARTRRALRYAPIEVTATAAFGPRTDLFIFGAALQWLTSTVREDAVGGLSFPQEVSRDFLLERLFLPAHPHSFMTIREGRWDIDPPTRPVSLLGWEEELRRPDASSNEREGEGVGDPASDEGRREM